MLRHKSKWIVTFGLFVYLFSFQTSIASANTLIPVSIPDVFQGIAAYTVFEQYSTRFNAYVSRYLDLTYLYIEPLSGFPFICGASYSIIQNGIQYDDVQLLTLYGESQCGDVYVPQLYRLTYWSSVENPPDLTQEFTLIHDFGTVETLTVPTSAQIILTASTGVDAFVTRFYRQCLNREPERTGLVDWVNALLNGTLYGADVANGFIFSQEFINRNTSNEDFVTILYRAFFGREPDTPGFNGWVNYLYNGATRQDVLNGFIYSQEFENLCTSYGISPYSA